MAGPLAQNSHPTELREKNGGSGGGGGGGSAPENFKHIILGIDGTWQAAYRDIFQSNVFKMNVALNYEDARGNPQIFIYSAGVGTANRSSRAIAGALGEGLDELILEAYVNLVSNYLPGDKIYIFGFSRGAVAARALTGLISYSGLLKANSSSLIEPAWKYFVGLNPGLNYPSIKGDNTHENVSIDFLGVWDTVPGPYKRDDLRRKYRFETLQLDSSVRRGVHVLSIDESRADFAPLLWEGRHNEQQTMEQIWLPGVHTDIGGGYSDSFMSTISLLCMIDRLAHYCPDLEFDTDYIQRTFLPILRNERVAINDEWKDYIGRFFKRFMRSYRIVRHEAGHNHQHHPVIDMMHQQQITIRGRAGSYIPTIYPNDQARRLAAVQFHPESWYIAHLETILRQRFPRR